MYDQNDAVGKIIDESTSIAILQADNPDADSLGSALALESILGKMGKAPLLYCAVDMPGYLKYMSGWDRVQKDLASGFDAAIIVDASTRTLFEKYMQSGEFNLLSKKRLVVLDHHEVVENQITADVTINDHTRASTGELIYLLSKELKWPLPKEALGNIMNSILGDTQGLTNQLAGAQTYRIIAEMLEAGVNRAELEDKRREYNKMAPEIFKYKADLIKRTQFNIDGRLAIVDISQSEINQYSPLYNPAPLIQTDMLQTSGVEIAIVLKNYADGKITGAIRSNNTAPIAAKLAEALGGGGHAFASGFKILDAQGQTSVKQRCITLAQQLLSEIKDGA